MIYADNCVNIVWERLFLSALVLEYKVDLISFPQFEEVLHRVIHICIEFCRQKR